MPKDPKPAEINATAASVLGFLDAMGPMTGFDVMANVERVISDFWNVTKSQIYRELKILAKLGLVETLKTGARDKQPYRITKAGREAFRAWIRGEPGPPVMRLPFVLEIFFGGEVPFDDLRAHAAKMRAYHAERLRVYETFLPEAPEGTWPGEALRLGIMFQRTMIAWIDGLPKKPLKPRARAPKSKNDRP